MPDSVLVQHLGGQAETNRFAIESVLKATMPAVRHLAAVPNPSGVQLHSSMGCDVAALLLQFLWLCCFLTRRDKQKPVQALKRFEQTAVSDSEKIEENIEQLLAGFSLNGPLTYSVTLDVMPPVAWKQPYKGIRVRCTLTLMRQGGSPNPTLPVTSRTRNSWASVAASHLFHPGCLQAQCCVSSMPAAPKACPHVYCHLCHNVRVSFRQTLPSCPPLPG